MADRDDLIRADVVGDDRGLADDDARAPFVDDRVRRAEVEPDVGTDGRADALEERAHARASGKR
jgi:hypothetical protein